MFADLTSYFTRSSSSTNPSTRGSGVGHEAAEGETPLVNTQELEENVVPMPAEEVQGQEDGDAIYEGIILSSIRIISSLIRVFAFQLTNLVLILDMRLVELSLKKVQLSLVAIFFLKGQKIEVFKEIGLRNMTGWNIVWRRIRLIASFVTFLEMI